MGQISVTPITSAAAPASALQTAPAVNRELNRAVSTAVNQLNDISYAGAGREVTFSIDQTTKAPVVKLIDTTTREVILQWPPEYLLQLAAENTKDSRDSG